MELGSEFNLNLSELEIQDHHILDELNEFNYIMFDSGRNALKALFESIDSGDGIILLPEYICESVINIFPIDRVVFYRINEDFSIDIDSLDSVISNSVSVFFLMHYFGTVQGEDLLDYLKQAAKNYNFIIIEDTTHSIFSRQRTIGDYMICSLRKWLPNPGCGLLYSCNPLDSIKDKNFNKSTDNERVAAMMLKNMYLNGLMDCNEEYRAIFENCERRIDDEREVKLPSDISVFLVKCFDTEKIRARRIDNYKYLMSRIGKMGYVPQNKIKNGECPFAYVIRIKDRDRFRKYLMENKIYCAVHWPLDMIQNENRPLSVINANTLISLPVDQRYGKDEIDYLADVILKYV